MSHNVQYLMSPDDIDPDRFPTTVVGSGVPNPGTSAQFEIDTLAGRVQCILGRDFGFGILWTDINYYRFLYHGERAEAVAYLDRWVESFCSRAVRVDESLLDEWLAGLDEESSTSDVTTFIDWAMTKEKEGTYWQRLGRF
jgi:hypothetical protein